MRGALDYSTRKEQKRIEVLDGVGHWHCNEAGEIVAGHINDSVARLWCSNSWGKSMQRVEPTSDVGWWGSGVMLAQA